MSPNSRIFYQCLLAIHYLQKRSIAHRDIKPENILLDDDFKIKLCDFGWAKIMHQDEVRVSICGTYEYMPPEVVNQEPHSLKADVWSLGILLYEMLHGKAPFRAKSLEEIKRRIKEDQIFLNSGLSTKTKKLIKQLLRMDSKKRSSAAKILEFVVENYDVSELEKEMGESEQLELSKNYYLNRYKIVDERVVRQKMKEDKMTWVEKEESRKKPLKYFHSMGLNKDLARDIVNIGDLSI